jgi:hypothetical protein
MKRNQPGRGRRQVKRTFEASRLSQTYLEEAYEKIVPRYIRVLHLSTVKLESVRPFKVRPLERRAG